MDIWDIHNLGRDTRETALALRKALKVLAHHSTDPVAAQLTTCAAACEVLVDKAAAVSDMTGRA